MYCWCRPIITCILNKFIGVPFKTIFSMIQYFFINAAFFCMKKRPLKFLNTFLTEMWALKIIILSTCFIFCLDEWSWLWSVYINRWKANVSTIASTYHIYWIQSKHPLIDTAVINCWAFHCLVEGALLTAVLRAFILMSAMTFLASLTPMQLVVELDISSFTFPPSLTRACFTFMCR